MHHRYPGQFCRRLATFMLFCALSAMIAHAQTRDNSQQQPTSSRPNVHLPQEGPPARVAGERELDCSGQIETTPTSTALEVVGAEQEQEQRSFAEGDYLYLSGGAQQGITAGQEFSVVRPRGQFRSRLSRKKGSLGIFTQEVGRVRVVEVKDNVSVAFVNKSCDTILFGDLLRPLPQRISPERRPAANLERFADSTGKQNGRIVLARDSREMISKDQVVFIDLGAEDNLKVGDYLIVYRPAGTGIAGRARERELAANSRDGFESERYRGGKFSNQSQRVRNPQGGSGSETVNTPEIRDRRPAVPRHVVGEIVVLNVQGRTATAVITRVTQEIHTGDFVELQ